MLSLWNEGLKEFHVLEEIVEDGNDFGLSSTLREYAVYDETENSVVSLLMKDEWLEVRLKAGVRINLIGPKNQINRNPITAAHDTQVLVIVMPEIAIQVTKIVTSLTCKRRAWLSGCISPSIKTRFSSSIPLIGSLIHSFVEKALEKNCFEIEFLMSTAEGVIQESVVKLWGVDQDQNSVLAILFSIIEPLQKWAFTHINRDNKQNFQVQPSFVITSILKTEQKIWSARYGIKGIVDCVAVVNVNNSKNNAICAIEIKSSKSTDSVAHRAQVLLYSLLIAESYCRSYVYGVLYYVRNEVSKFVDLIFGELRSLLIQRNIVVLQSSAKIHDIPEMIDKEYVCKNCELLNECVIHHLVFEDKHLGKQSLIERTNLANSLDTKDLAFIRKWLSLLDMERQFAQKRNVFGGSGDNTASLCAFSLIRREDSLHLTQFSAGGIHLGVSLDNSAASGYTYYFKLFDNTKALEEGNYISGLRVTIRRNICSSPPVLTGIIVSCTCDSLVVRSHKQIELPSECFNDTQYIEKSKFFILVSENLNSEGAAESILLSLFSGDSGSEKLKSLTVYSKPPRFSNVPFVDEDISMLNCEQQFAVRKIESAMDYVLVLGMPGTGKSRVIVEVISRLLKKNNSILLSCYTHNAIDHILLKLIRRNIKFLRICEKTRTNVKIQPYTDQVLSQGLSLKELGNLYTSINLVAVTCLGLNNHPIFKKRMFDYCIVDEASQISLPVSLSPLRYSKVFVLVGDLYQLPPLVSSQEAYNSGLGVSLFKSLSECHPESLVRLRLQYRMNQDIMSLSNYIVYNGKLQCATPDVADRKIFLPSMEDALSGLHLMNAYESSSEVRGPISRCSYSNNSGSCWLLNVLNPDNRVIFINTDPLESNSITKEGKSFSSMLEYEAAVAMRIAGSLLDSGVLLSEIAVITPYRMQVRLMSQFLPGNFPLSIHTIDRFQGSDCECVILSVSSTQGNKNSSHLLSDWRRLNVAITRAKSKFIVVGSFSIMSKIPCLNSLLNYIIRMGWFLDIGSYVSHVEPDMTFLLHKKLSQLSLSGLTPSQNNMKVKRSDTSDIVSPSFKRIRSLYHNIDL